MSSSEAEVCTNYLRDLRKSESGSESDSQTIFQNDKENAGACYDEELGIVFASDAKNDADNKDYCSVSPSPSPSPSPSASLSSTPDRSPSPSHPPFPSNLLFYVKLCLQNRPFPMDEINLLEHDDEADEADAADDEAECINSFPRTH